jgi:EpsI family protein
MISKELGAWRCYEVEPQRSTYSDPSADSVWSGFCEAAGGARREVYAGYAEWQGQQKRFASPRLHYPEGDPGWSYLTAERIDVPTNGQCGGPLQATGTVLQHAAGQKQAVLYWYQRGSRAFPDDVAFRLDLIRARVTGMPTDGVVVRIAVPVSETSKESAFREHTDLARGIYCTLAGS